jgi:hypothetical protein
VRQDEVRAGIDRRFSGNSRSKISLSRRTGREFIVFLRGRNGHEQRVHTGIMKIDEFLEIGTVGQFVCFFELSVIDPQRGRPFLVRRQLSSSGVWGSQHPFYLKKFDFHRKPLFFKKT